MEFGASFIIFIAAHIVPAACGLRERMIAIMGRGRYIAAYALLSTALLLWVIWSMQRAPYVELWPPSPLLNAVPLVVMPVALALLGAAVARPNPLSISFRRAEASEAMNGVLSITRHPVLWAVLLWSASHLLANGDLVAAVLFGSMALFSVQGMVALDRRARKKLGEQVWRELARTSSALPLVALLHGRTDARINSWDLVGACAGIAVYLVMLASGHEWLIGISPTWR